MLRDRFYRVGRVDKEGGEGGLEMGEEGWGGWEGGRGDGVNMLFSAVGRCEKGGRALSSLVDAMVYVVAGRVWADRGFCQLLVVTVAK